MNTAFPFFSNVSRLACLILFCVLLADTRVFAQGDPPVRPRIMPQKNRIPFPGLLREPYLQSATSNSIVVRWRTDALARSRVRYGTQPGNLDMFVDDSTLVFDHRVKLAGLAPRTRYYYQIGALKDTLQGDAGNYFYTLPVPGKAGSYRIGIFGDCGTDYTQQHNIRDQFLKYLGDRYLDAWILLGDNAYENGTDAQFQKRFFEVFKDNLLKRSPLFPAPGNHDYGNIDFYAREVPARVYDVAYYQIFSMPTEGEAGGVASHNPAYYSFDIGNIHFLSLDSYGWESDGARLYDTLSPQARWVKNDLENNRNRDWVVVYLHHPPYTMGTHNSDEDADLIQIRTDLNRILERYGVDLVIAGHSHVYERSRLMKGHHGMEADFDPRLHNLSQSSGLYNGEKDSCPYIKDSKSNAGTVYVVCGSGGKLGETEKSFPHEAMYYSNAEKGGAGMLEVEGNRLDFKWICEDGEIRDKFTMMKDVNRVTAITHKRGAPLTLTASFEGEYRWLERNLATRSIQVTPPRGVTTYTVKDPFGCIQETFRVTVPK